MNDDDCTSGHLHFHNDDDDDCAWGHLNDDCALGHLDYHDDDDDSDTHDDSDDEEEKEIHNNHDEWCQNDVPTVTLYARENSCSISVSSCIFLQTVFLFFVLEIFPNPISLSEQSLLSSLLQI